MEEFMSPAGQAFMLTGELFVLSFVGIYAFWLADKLRRNFFGQPPRDPLAPSRLRLGG
jgi:hypothetical protein